MGALIVSVLCVLVISLWDLFQDPVLTPEDHEEAATRIENATTDITAAASDALNRHEAVTDASVVDAAGIVIHRRASHTHCVLQIVDRDTGMSVSRARVEFFSTHLLKAVWHRESLFARQPVVVAESEEDGSVWLPLTVRGVLHVDVAGPEYHATEFVRIQLPGGKVTPTVVQAARGGRIRGRVVTRSFEPVAPARVMAMPSAAVMMNVMQGAHLTMRTSHVAADGSYELHGIPADNGWRVAAIDGAFWPSTSDGFSVRPGDEVGIDVVVTAARTLYGRVRNRGGQAVADAVVSYTTKPPSGLDGYDLMQRFAASRRQTWTDGAGRFALPGVPAAKVQIWAAHVDHGASERLTVDLRPTRMSDVHLVLDGGSCVAGRVTDMAGSAVVGATVMWLGKRSKNRPTTKEEQAVVTTKEDGSFYLPLPSGDKAINGNILVRCKGYASRTESVSVPSSRVVEIELQPGRAIVGKVVAKETGRPVTEFSLLIDVPKAVRGLGREARDARALRFRSTSGTFRTEAEFGGVLEVTVESKGFDSATVTIDLGKNGDEPLLFELQPTLSLTGVVVDEAGAVVPNATVEASNWQMVGLFSLNATMDARRTKTDEAGRFELTEVRPSKDKYLHVQHDDFLSMQNKRVRVNGASFPEQRFVLRRGGGLTGVVSSSSGMLCRGFEVVGLSLADKGSLHRATTDGAGNYSLDQLDPKMSYDLAVLPPGAAFNMRQLFAGIVARGLGVRAGWVTRADLTYDDSGNSTVRGRVSYRSGAAVAGATVMLLDDGATDVYALRGSRRTTTSADGHFEIDRVTAGQYVVTFGELSGDRNEARSGRKSITVASTASLELDLVIETGELRGVVTDSHTDLRLAHVRVFVQSADTHGSAPHNAMLLRLQSRRTNARGEFAFRALPPGSYRLLALPKKKSPYAGTSTGLVAVGPEGSVANAAIALQRGVLVRVRVNDREGPVVGAQVILRPVGGSVPAGSGVTSAAGVLELRSVPAGSYEAFVQQKDRVSAVQIVQVPVAGTVQVEFVLPR